MKSKVHPTYKAKYRRPRGITTWRVMSDNGSGYDDSRV